MERRPLQQRNRRASLFEEQRHRQREKDKGKGREGGEVEMSAAKERGTGKEKG